MMRVNKYLMPLVVLVALWGTVLVARAVGYWQTSGQEMIDPNKPLISTDIKGWMSLEYVSEEFGIAPGELYEMLGIPDDTPPVTPLKDLEAVVEVSEVRAIIGEYLGEGAAPPQATAAPEVTPTVALPTATHIPGTGAGSGEGTGVGPTPLPAGQILPAAEIKGKMTLREVSEQCDVPLEALFAALELPKGVSPETVLRDLQEQAAGFEVSRMREVVAELQAK